MTRHCLTREINLYIGPDIIFGGFLTIHLLLPSSGWKSSRKAGKAWHLPAACSQAGAAGIWGSSPRFWSSLAPYPVPHAPPVPAPPSSAFNSGPASRHNTEELCASVHPHIYTHARGERSGINAIRMRRTGGKVQQAPLGCSTWLGVVLDTHKLPIIHC